MRGRAVERLPLFLHLPQTEGIIHLLTGSWDENVADAAKEALKEYRIGPPSDRPHGGLEDKDEEEEDDEGGENNGRKGDIPLFGE